VAATSSRRPSLHADGQRYRWIARHRPAPLPCWLTQLLTAAAPPARRTVLPEAASGERWRRYFAAAVRSELANVAAARPGTRNDTLNRAAFRLGQLTGAGYATLEELTAPLLAAALAAGLTEAESLATINSGTGAGQRHPRRTRHTPPARGVRRDPEQVHPPGPTRTMMMQELLDGVQAVGHCGGQNEDRSREPGSLRGL
jgi:hypothetical protein